MDNVKIKELKSIINNYVDSKSTEETHKVVIGVIELLKKEYAGMYIVERLQK